MSAPARCETRSSHGQPQRPRGSLIGPGCRRASILERRVVRLLTLWVADPRQDDSGRLRRDVVSRPIASIRLVLRRAVRSKIVPLLGWRDLDKESVSVRLRAIGGPHAETSGIYPPATHERSSTRLLEIVTNVVPLARDSSLPMLEARHAPKYVHLWPGEHYRLLAALVRLLKPSLVVEIGTYRGHSVLAMLPELGPNARIVTMDVVPWTEIPECLLRSEDFQDGRLVQVIADVGDRQEAERQADFIRSADLLFVDAAKDGALERRILANFEAIGLKDGVVVVFDDIRVWNMLGIWRGITRPKLDVTSLGHYSGTGLIDWSGPNR
jgi:predicted O-methyltransferase YrrM